MNSRSKYRIKTAAVWFLVNTAISLLLFSFVSVNSVMPRWTLFWITMIRTHIISSMTACAGYLLGNFFGSRKLIPAILLALPGTLFVSIIAYVISYIIVMPLFKSTHNHSIFYEIYGMIFPIIMISTSVTVITTVIERLRTGKSETEKNLYNIKQSLEDFRQARHAVFSIKEDEARHVIKHDDIIYLSSHGKKTSFHTIEKDYDTNQLLKEIEEKLPAEYFLRIHKQFIINTRFLLKIQYYEGGRYMAFLKDDDESCLPVGRKFVPILKNKLGITL